jgi:AcrR family transcriptional regulator
VTRSARSRPRNADATRSHILDCATRLFLERGYEGTSILEVAALAGYTSGAVYRHFPGKSSLILAVIKHAIADVPPVLSADTQREPLPSLVALLMTFSMPAMRDVRKLTIALKAAGQDDRTVGDLQREFERTRIEQIARLIAAADCGIDAAQAEEKAKLVIMLMLGLCHIDSVAPELAGTPQAEALIAALLGGLVASGRDFA